MITAIILAKNEEKNIVDCIESIKFCNEIIVIDDFSTDRTSEIASGLGARVIKRRLNNDFSGQRNYALSLAKNDWILFIDADERVSEELSYEILSAIRSNKSQGYFVKRIDSMWGKNLIHGETGNRSFLRFAQKDAGRWKGKVHEYWEVGGKVGKLTNPILHFPHQTIEEFLKEINFYTDLRAKELFEKGKAVKWYSVLLYPKSKFILNYFLKRGFMDGLHGFIFALMMSFHSFLVRGKLWQLNQEN